ncbi:hypothetical protein L208DRAFT_1143249, partial [Tricholoma matsutake]
SLRKPFVPLDHWLVTSQTDVQFFVEAAIILNNISIPFNVHVSIFHNFVYNDAM